DGQQRRRLGRGGDLGRDRSRGGCSDGDVRQDGGWCWYGYVLDRSQACESVCAWGGGVGDEVEYLPGADGDGRPAAVEGLDLCRFRWRSGGAAGGLRSADVQEHERGGLV